MSQDTVENRLLRIGEIESMTGLKRQMLYKLIAADEFPRPIHLTSAKRTVAWRLDEVNRWIDSRPRVEGRHAA